MHEKHRLISQTRKYYTNMTCIFKHVESRSSCQDPSRQLLEDKIIFKYVQRGVNIQRTRIVYGAALGL